MSVFDKIKNALFEEEYVEVEEKPKKAKRELFKKEVSKEKKQEEKPIAKRVVLPEKKEVKVKTLEEEELFDNNFDVHPKEVKPALEKEAQKDFKIMDDSDFQVDNEVVYSDVEPKIVKVIEREEKVSYPKEEEHYYQEKHREKKPYGIEQTNTVPAFEYGGAYEKKEEKTYFKPSPIISPIYGILDKNYKKEDVVAKREVRLTSSYARENLSVDDVRKKAYGNLDDDLVNEIEDFHPKKEESFEIKNDDEEDANLLVDLSMDEEKPSVKEVTMGDALEYFQDLGLEYNVDYVDATKEKACGRRVKENYDEAFNVVDDVENRKHEEKTVVKEEKKISVEKGKMRSEEKDVDIDSDDNLFDLIDSMYKEEY